MNVNEIERAAYIAAHRLLSQDTSAPELACPGARRSRMVDNIAAVIQDVFDVEVTRAENAAIDVTNPSPSAMMEIARDLQATTEVIAIRNEIADKLKMTIINGTPAA